MLTIWNGKTESAVTPVQLGWTTVQKSPSIEPFLIALARVNSCYFFPAIHKANINVSFHRQHANLAGTLSGHGSWVLNVAFCPDDTHFVSSSSDKSVKVWDAGTRTCVHTFFDHQDQVWLLFPESPRSQESLCSCAHLCFTLVLQLQACSNATLACYNKILEVGVI